MRKSRRSIRNIFIDTVIVSISIWVAIWLADIRAFDAILTIPPAFQILAIFLAGSLFTSIITVPSAVVILAGLSSVVSWWQLVVFGALGAVAGDYILFRFVKDRVAGDIAYLLKHSSRYKAFVHLVARRKFRYLALLFAGLVIASPLPDEVAMTMLGVAKSKDWDMVRISFVFNALGILGIASVAQAFAG